jgi:Na+/melibiose symporter-like transporter
LEHGDLWWFFVILAFYGIAGGNFNAISMSMKADVIEIAARRASENVSGAYISVWSLGQKLVIAVALGTALPLLGVLGFDPQATHTAQDLQTLALVYVLPPWLFYALAVIILWRYPISKARLDRIRSALQRRDERHARDARVAQLP